MTEAFSPNYLLLIGEPFKALDKKCALFKCKCGTEKVIDYNAVVSNRIRSCGCLRLEKAKATCIARNTSHGLSKTRLYKIWKLARQRCNNPNLPDYRKYGARGIRICDEWGTYERFHADMAASYVEHCKEHGVMNTSIDRIDVDKGYSKENCRWATWNVQARNRTDAHKIEFNGVSKSTKTWADEYGLKDRTLKHRLKRGWSVEKALTTPVTPSQRGIWDRKKSLPQLNDGNSESS